MFALFALGLGWVLVRLERFEPTQQALIALVLLLIPFVSLVYLIRPHVVINIFIFVIPLLVGQKVIVGLNLGELATLFIMSLGLITLLITSQEKLITTLKQLGSLIWSLLGLAFVGLISALTNSVFSVLEIVAAVFKPLAFAIVMLLLFVHNDSQKKVYNLLRALLLGGFVVAGYSILAYVMGWSYYPQYGYNRASGTFEHWNQLGGYMVLTSLSTLGLALAMSKSINRFILLLVFFLEITALLLSLTLGSIISFLIGITLLFAKVKVKFRGIRYLLLLSTIVAIAVLIATETGSGLRLSNVEERYRGRIASYISGAYIALENFWFGAGSSEQVQIKIWSGNYGPETYSISHNSFITIWAEKGIFGLLLFVYIIFRYIQLLLQCRFVVHNTAYYTIYWGIVAGIVGFLYQNLANNLIIHARLGIIFFAFLVLVLRLTQFAQGNYSNIKTR